jgi:hypothetical protein
MVRFDIRMVASIAAMMIAGPGCGGGADLAPTTFNITPAGGTLSLAGGAVKLDVPAGAVDSNMTITATLMPTPPPAPTLVGGIAYAFTPDGIVFHHPVAVTISYQGAVLPTGVRETELGVYKVVGSGWQSFGGTVDTVAKTLVASIPGFSTYGILGAPVASVTVAPPSATLLANGTVQLTATPKAANATALPARVVTWNSSAPGVATVSASGLVTAVALGSATITATSEGINGTSAITVSSPSALYPHQPAGYTVLADLDFSSKTVPAGWAVDAGWNNNTHVHIVSDGAAPQSPPGVVEFLYPIGFSDQAGYPGDAGFTFTTPVREIYVSMWVMFSNPWETHSTGVNKVFFVGTNASFAATVFTVFGNPITTAQGRISVQSPPNNGTGTGNGYYIANMAQPGFSLGAWHHVEVVLKRSTGGLANGSMTWWMDGTLTGNYSIVNYNASVDALFTNFSITPNWGGNTQQVKTENDFIRVDHIFVSGLP